MRRRQRRECSARRKVRGAGQRLQPHRREHQERPAAQGVDEIIAPRPQRLLRPVMHHERIGGEGQEFVEDEEGDEVAGERDARGRADADAEETEEAAAVRFAFQITHRIERGEKPQHGRERDEQDGHGVGAQHEIESRQQFEPGLIAVPPAHAGNHHAHEGHLKPRAQQVEERAQPVRLLAEEENDQPGDEGTEQDENQQERIKVHGRPPTAAATGADTRAS